MIGRDVEYFQKNLTEYLNKYVWVIYKYDFAELKELIPIPAQEISVERNTRIEQDLSKSGHKPNMALSLKVQAFSDSLFSLPLVLKVYVAEKSLIFSAENFSKIKNTEAYQNLLKYFEAKQKQIIETMDMDGFDESPELITIFHKIIEDSACRFRYIYRDLCAIDKEEADRFYELGKKLIKEWKKSVSSEKFKFYRDLKTLITCIDLNLAFFDFFKGIDVYKNDPDNLYCLKYFVKLNEFAKSKPGELDKEGKAFALYYKSLTESYLCALCVRYEDYDKAEEYARSLMKTSELLDKNRDTLATQMDDFERMVSEAGIIKFNPFALLGQAFYKEQKYKKAIDWYRQAVLIEKNEIKKNLYLLAINKILEKALHLNQDENENPYKNLTIKFNNATQSLQVLSKEYNERSFSYYDSLAKLKKQLEKLNSSKVKNEESSQVTGQAPVMTTLSVIQVLHEDKETPKIETNVNSSPIVDVNANVNIINNNDANSINANSNNNSNNNANNNNTNSNSNSNNNANDAYKATKPRNYKHDKNNNSAEDEKVDPYTLFVDVAKGQKIYPLYSSYVSDKKPVAFAIFTVEPTKEYDQDCVDRHRNCLTKESIGPGEAIRPIANGFKTWISSHTSSKSGDARAMGQVITKRKNFMFIEFNKMVCHKDYKEIYKYKKI